MLISNFSFLKNQKVKNYQEKPRWYNNVRQHQTLGNTKKWFANARRTLPFVEHKEHEMSLDFHLIDKLVII